ncbi:MAG: single-stranded DNA-binding protein [Mariprofundaceae bacterium]|nr:single-stranded DNA-binding protein [Mariprofundaceae bacterium]
MPQPEENQVCLKGVLADIHERWTPDGSPAAIASLVISRPNLGAARATSEPSQPIPLRATGNEARQLAQHDGHTVAIEGRLRRRYYNREGESRWGQVEVWVDRCQPISQEV